MSCLDESISVLTNQWTCPGWIFVPRKPIWWGMKIIQYAAVSVEKCTHSSWPREVPSPQFSQFGQTTGLLLCLTDSINHLGSKSCDYGQRVLSPFWETCCCWGLLLCCHKGAKDLVEVHPCGRNKWEAFRGEEGWIRGRATRMAWGTLFQDILLFEGRRQGNEAHAYLRSIEARGPMENSTIDDRKWAARQQEFC